MAKKLLIFFAAFTFIIGLSSYKSDGNEGTDTEKVSVHPKELPSLARKYIMHNFPGAVILKAEKVEPSVNVFQFKVELRFKEVNKQLTFNATGNYLSENF